MIEPISVYLHCRQEKGDLPGSLRQSAYVLREYFAWLGERCIEWTAIRDDLLTEWLTPQSGLQEVRIERKCHVVFDFYLRLQQRGYLTSIGVERDIVGVGHEFALQAEEVHVRSWSRTGARRISRRSLSPVIARPFSTALPRPKRRRVPSEAEVAALLDHLLESSDAFAPTRNWFCAVYMARVGLRREGVASLTVDAFEQALEAAGIAIPSLTREADRAVAVRDGWSPRLHGLEALAFWPNGQDQLIDSLLEHARSREHLPVSVVEKGRKQRWVQVPLDLVRATLRSWVWDHRARMVASARSTDVHGLRAMWISQRTGKAMTAGAIGNEIKAAFRSISRSPRLALSPHRLRAFYLTQLVRKLYRKALALQGKLLDVRAILAQAAELAGHEDPASLQAYLDVEMMANLALEGQAVMVASTEHAELLRGISESLGEANADGLWRDLNDLAARHHVRPIPEISTALDAVAALARHEARARIETERTR